MAFGSNLLSGILSTLFGEDIFSDDKNNAEAEFGRRTPGNNYKSSIFSDPLDDIPEGEYTSNSKTSSYSNDRSSSQPRGYANSKRNQNTSYNRTNSSNTSKNTYNSRTTNNSQSSSSSRSSYSSRTNNYSNTNTTTTNNNNNNSQKNYYSQTNNYSKNNDYSDYGYNQNSSSNQQYKYYDFNEFNEKGYYSTDSNNYSNNYSNNQRTKNTWDSYTNDKIKKDQSSTASQGFRRQHATKSKDGFYTYPTLSSKGSKTVKNDKAVLVFGNPNFKTYDHGVRGIAFPYYLKINDPFNRKIVVSAKFCNSSGAWIKSLVPEMADRYGDLIVNESVYCIDSSFEVDSYLFVPFGVLALKTTQKIYLNIDVFVDGSGPQHLLRYVYGFEYYVYENDPRETESNTDFNDKQVGFDELIGLVAHVIKADKVCSPEEIRAVIDFFKNFRGVNKDNLKEKLKYKLSNLSNLDRDCEVLKNNFNTQTRISFLSLLFKIAVSDDSVPLVEIDLIEKISDKMGVLKSTFISLKAEYLPATDNVWHLFGLTPNATKEQVKAAYRQKCKECHPDRFANASKEEYKKAEERFKELQEFYGFLMRKFE